MSDSQFEKEVTQHMAMVNKFLLSRGGRVVLKYEHLSDVPAGADPPSGWTSEIIDVETSADGLTDTDTKVPTSAAVVDYVAAHGGEGMGSGSGVIDCGSPTSTFVPGDPNIDCGGVS